MTNNYDLIFVIVGLQGLFLFLFLVQKGSIKHNVLATITMIITIDSISHIDLFQPYLQLINHGNLFAVGPLFYIFYQLLNEDKWNRTMTLHIVPIIILKVLLLVIGIGEIRVSYAMGASMSFTMAVYNIIYSAVIIFLLYRNQALGRSEKRLLFLSYILLLGWLVALGARILDLYNEQSGDVVWKITYGVAGMLIYYLTLSFMQAPRVFEISSYSYQKEKNLKRTIEDLMVREKLYLDSQFKREDLALKLGIDPHELSFVLNQKLNISFNDLVNRYRINDCLARFRNRDAENMTISYIGLECGFGSKATFQRAFKKHTGYTPVAYLQKEVSNN